MVVREPAMTWAECAADTLAEALNRPARPGGVVVAVAAISAAETVIRVNPAGTPAEARFEVGSVSKAMTATVLAVLVREGVLGLEDEIGRWLSAGQHRGIMVGQLATHTSGLPDYAPNRERWQADPGNPWAGYTFSVAEEGLRQASATPGRPWRYSNLGYQLLGLIMQRASGQEYPMLMADRLFAPVLMTHSGVGPRGLGTLLPGHVGSRLIRPWDQPWGAGGIEATLGDLIRFARACAFPPDNGLGAAMTLAQTPVLWVEEGTAQALAWVVRDGGVAEHHGGTGGFSACVTADHGRGRAIAIAVSEGGGTASAFRMKQLARLVLSQEEPRRDAEGGA
jgi:CubicO group peptidase (beta-lactamase class C family)